MGVVYRARDLRLDRPVAVKLLRPGKMQSAERKARFIKEAKAASALNHPNIITIHEIGEQDGADYMVMEYVDGKMLDALIPRHGMRPGEALKIALQVVEGLVKAHGAGIIHRDLKPSNVMVSNDGLVKILDFGLAKLVDRSDVSAEDETRTALATEEGMVMGTVAYMSPEQAEGKKVDARSDIFSFGSMFYEMLTGRRAFVGETAPATMTAVIRDNPKPDELPVEMRKLVGRCLRKELDRRFQTAADLRAVLLEAKEESESVAGVAPVASKRAKLRWVWVAAGVAVAAMGGIGFWLRGRQPPVKPPEMRLTRITANPADLPVTGAAISPDAKYLVYSDSRGIRLRRMQNGEERLLPDTAGMRPSHWFPDGTEFLASAGTPAKPQAWRISIVTGMQPKRSDLVLPSPDGGRLLRLDRPSDEEGNWWIEGNATPAPRKVGEYRNGSGLVGAAWSPDRSRLAGIELQSNSLAKMVTIDAASGSVEPLPFDVTKGFSGFNWLPDGRIIVSLLRDSNWNLWQVKPDVKTGKVQGDPVRITNWTDRIPSQFSFSADGKRVVFLNSITQNDIHIASVNSGTISGTPRRLTLDDRTDIPYSWTADGKSVIFTSDRNGTSDIFKQDIDKDMPEVLVGGPDRDISARITPQGDAILYTSGPEDRRRLMRLPLDGGNPKVLAEVSNRTGNHCLLAGGCVLNEREGGDMVVYELDPLRGKGKLLFRYPLSPAFGPLHDKKRFSYAVSGTARVRIVHSDGSLDREIAVQNAARLVSLDWAPDDKGFYTANQTLDGTELLYVDLEGRSRVLYRVPGLFQVWAIPSPDGRQLAIMSGTRESNVWMLENF